MSVTAPRLLYQMGRKAPSDAVSFAQLQVLGFCADMLLGSHLDHLQEHPPESGISLHLQISPPPHPEQQPHSLLPPYQHHVMLPLHTQATAPSPPGLPLLFPYTTPLPLRLPLLDLDYLNPPLQAVNIQRKLY